MAGSVTKTGLRRLEVRTAFSNNDSTKKAIRDLLVLVGKKRLPPTRHILEATLLSRDTKAPYFGRIHVDNVGSKVGDLLTASILYQIRPKSQPPKLLRDRLTDGHDLEWALDTLRQAWAKAPPVVVIVAEFVLSDWVPKRTLFDAPTIESDGQLLSLRGMILAVPAGTGGAGVKRLSWEELSDHRHKVIIDYVGSLKEGTDPWLDHQSIARDHINRLM